jgi:Fe2+ or Zn2+ uptake regulation protein
MQRKSKQKEVILKVLKDTNSHPTAEGVYEQVKREIPHISLGTVYRNLRLLKQGGAIVELDIAGTLSRFDGNTQPHYHFRCEQCERIFDVDEPLDKAIDSKVAQRTGFKVTHHRLEFRGSCQDCQS